jgi:hypothetical protein
MPRERQTAGRYQVLSGIGDVHGREKVALVHFVTAATRNCPEMAMKLPAGGHENCPAAVMRSARHV